MCDQNIVVFVLEDTQLFFCVGNFMRAQNIVFILTGHSGFYVFFCVEFFMCT